MNDKQALILNSVEIGNQFPTTNFSPILGVNNDTETFKHAISDGYDVIRLNIGAEYNANLLETVSNNLGDIPICLQVEQLDIVNDFANIYQHSFIVSVEVDVLTRHAAELCALLKKHDLALMVQVSLDNGNSNSFLNDILRLIEENDLSPDKLIVDFIKGTECQILEAISLCNKSNIKTFVDLQKTLAEDIAQYSTFFAMASSLGLTAVSIATKQESVVASLLACDALSGRDKKLHRYVNKFSNVPAASKQTKQQSPEERVYTAVLQGNEDAVAPAIDEALKTSIPPSKLVDDYLIPAITKVGELFDKKEYFLPQLIMSADAMSKGFEHLAPYLEADGNTPEKQKIKVIMATVKGDIHDIGKNIVALMLKNYNFDVIDLGKDVSAEDIIDAITKHDVKIVGLSALMTTTMTEMKVVIDEARKNKLNDVKFMIGGAVIDQEYATEIGADGYAADAMAAVHVAQSFC